MAKTEKTIIFGLFVLALILSLSLTSANTLVGGKIYNSDFGDVIDGASVSVTCGAQVLDTESLSDGAYAVIFDSSDCPLGKKVSVTASKGSLSDSDSSIVYESKEEAGQLVSVVNLNIHSSAASATVVKKNYGGTWFMCGNTVCDSGETYDTCPLDCPKQTQPTNQTNLTTEITQDTTGANSGGDNSNTNTGTTGQNQTQTDESGNSPITGAVTGENKLSGRKSNIAIILVSLILLLIIAIAVIAGVADAKEKKRERLDAELAKANMK